MTHLRDHKKKQAMHNYLDAEVREFARMKGLDGNQTWELRVTTLAMMLLTVISEGESNSDSHKVAVQGGGWPEMLVMRIKERFGDFDEDMVEAFRREHE